MEDMASRGLEEQQAELLAGQADWAQTSCRNGASAPSEPDGPSEPHAEGCAVEDVSPFEFDTLAGLAAPLDSFVTVKLQNATLEDQQVGPLFCVSLQLCYFGPVHHNPCARVGLA